MRYQKYYRARLWCLDYIWDGPGETNRHDFAVFFAESDWDDLRAALKDWKEGGLR